MRIKFPLGPILELLLLFSFPAACYSAQVAFIQQRGEVRNWKEVAEVACQFYGVDVKVLTVGGALGDRETIATLKNRATVGVIASAKALSLLDRAAVLSALSRSDRDAVPLMILEITAATDTRFLKLWSAGAVVASAGLESVSSAGSYRFDDVRSVARQLAGQNLSFFDGSAFSLDLDPLRSAQTIIHVHDADHDLPVFVRIRNGRQDVFFQANYASGPLNSRGLMEVFPSIAPVLMFVRYASGERAWHSVGHYANLTIDDPWLTEPYGNLNYKGLLQEMQKVNFHTTIAFIPWNFDRSRPDVVSLFRDHPDRYSISVHGDNHDHQEFYDYAKVPLSDQVAALRQAVARMEAFKTLTKIPYDRVMVWPHEVVAPAPTLAVLKEYNFLGNVNTDPVPLNSTRPADLLFLLRPESLRFSSFPTIERIPAMTGSLQSRIAVNAFLENPILLWHDQDLFASGINAFDNTAALVNHIQPDSVWESLGNIIRHLFVVRLREDGDYDAIAFSSQIRLRNPQKRGVKFLVEKDESFGIPIKSLTVDGQISPYRRSGDSLLFEVAVPATQSRDVVITYENDLDATRADLSKSSLRVNLLRRFSDFRDLNLSINPLGAAAIRFYYGNVFLQRFPNAQFLGVMLFLFLAIGAAALGWWLVRRVRKTRV
jgi:hypothetical protein